MKLSILTGIVLIFGYFGNYNHLKSDTQFSFISKDKRHVSLDRIVLTPETFGAKGDGITDDTKAFLEALRCGYPIICNGTYNLSKKSLPQDRNNNPIYPSFNNRITLSGKGSILFDFHINITNEISISNIELYATGYEPNGLFTVLKTGKAYFDNVIFDGTRSAQINGGVSSRGKLTITNCTFIQSDVNIIAPEGSFLISDSSFDGNGANNASYLSNELIHIQSCNSGVIRGCSFRNSLQDIVDFYFGAKNVVFEYNDVYDNASTLFEIKAEYRNTDNPQGGNQLYKDHTENIVIRNNSFRIKAPIAWVGTRTDERTDRRFEDGYYVSNIEFYSNDIEVLGEDKVDLWYAKNVKGLSINNNLVHSESTPIFVLRVMNGEEYEVCEGISIENNQFESPSITVSYINGNIDDLIVKNNSIKHDSSESYLLLTTQKNNRIGFINIDNNQIISEYPIRFCTANNPFSCKNLYILNQEVKSFHLDSIRNITIASCQSPLIYQSGNVDSLKIESCIEPLVISKGFQIQNLKILNSELKQTSTFVGEEGIIKLAKYHNVSNKVTSSNKIRIQLTEIE